MSDNESDASTTSRESTLSTGILTEVSEADEPCSSFAEHIKASVRPLVDAGYHRLVDLLTRGYRAYGCQRSQMWHIQRARLVTSTTLAAGPETTVGRLTHSIAHCVGGGAPPEHDGPITAAMADGIRLEGAAVSATVARLSGDGPPWPTVSSPPLIASPCGCCGTSVDALCVDPVGKKVWAIEVKVPNHPHRLLQTFADTDTMTPPAGQATAWGAQYRQCSHHWRVLSQVLPGDVGLTLLATYDKRTGTLSGWRRFQPSEIAKHALSLAHAAFSGDIHDVVLACEQTRARFKSIEDTAAINAHVRCNADVACQRFRRHPRGVPRPQDYQLPGGAQAHTSATTMQEVAGCPAKAYESLMGGVVSSIAAHTRDVAVARIRDTDVLHMVVTKPFTLADGWVTRTEAGGRQVVRRLPAMMLALYNALMGSVDAIDASRKLFAHHRCRRAWRSVWWTLHANVIQVAYALALRTAPPDLPDFTLRDAVRTIVRHLLHEGAYVGKRQDGHIRRECNAHMPMGAPPDTSSRRPKAARRCFGCGARQGGVRRRPEPKIRGRGRPRRALQVVRRRDDEAGRGAETSRAEDTWSWEATESTTGRQAPGRRGREGCGDVPSRRYVVVGGHGEHYRSSGAGTTCFSGARGAARGC
eukprot:TRINITY_DN790_c0_g1_i11.p1 TRINITY_DN790_c0_g1~~TRINITY_DN790_c0_g1_i11.p1  ORF type:complete len:642 (-),score=53.33 TRINITY_DN790_c0_g1_i11:1570-3495(-)